MIWIFSFLLFINLSFAKECPFQKKGVSGTLPTLTTLNDKDAKIFKESLNQLCLNLKVPGPFSPGYRTKISEGPYLVLETIIASENWKHWDPRISEELLKSLFLLQGPQGNLQSVDKRKFIYQSPLVTWAVWNVYKKTQNIDFLKSIYPKLKLHHEWFLKNRVSKDGLFFWAYSKESGPKRTTLSTVDAVDLSSYMALSMETLSLIANELSLSQDRRHFLAQYEKLKVIMNKKLWDERRGMFFDWDRKNNKHIQLEKSSNLTPLVAGVANTRQAKRMMEKVIDPSYYNKEMPFPILAINKSPLWNNWAMDLAYLGVLGVKRYAQHQEAQYLAKKIVKKLFEEWKEISWRTDSLLGISLLMDFAGDSPKPYPKGPLEGLAPKFRTLLPGPQE
jgi:hypothetical protein